MLHERIGRHASNRFDLLNCVNFEKLQDKSAMVRLRAESDRVGSWFKPWAT